MKSSIILILIFYASSSVAQTNPFYDSLNLLYSDDKVLFEKFHQYKKQEGLIEGIQNEIAEIHNDSLEQYAIIAFYNQAYGYKWVDKEAITKLINKVIQNPESDSIKRLAMYVKEEREQGLIGQVLPRIKLVNADGEFIDVTNIKAKYIVIDLWATWCAPCIKDMANVPDLKEKYDFVEFYSISFDKDLDRMAKFVRKKKYDWPIVFAGENHELWDYFKVRALPQYFIVNEERKIIASTVFNLETELEMLK